MLNFIENILTLLKDCTSADDASLLYYDGYSLLNLKSTGNSGKISEVLFSINELLHIVNDEDSIATIKSSFENLLSEKKSQINFYQEIKLSPEDNNFYLLIAHSVEKKNNPVPDFLNNFFNSQIKAIGKLLLNYNTDYTILASLKLMEMGNWKNFLKELNEISGDIVFIVDNEGCFLSINSSGAELLDYTPDEIAGKHLTELLDAENINYTNAELSKLIEIRSEGSFEATFLTKYEKKVSVDLHVKTVISENRIIGLLGVGRNITIIRQLESKLKKLEPRLIEAERLITLERQRFNQHKALLDELNRLKSEFVSNISHELRTPLASIVGFSETINSDPKMPDELRSEFNSIILNEGKRLSKLINDVLDLSRIEAGVITLNKSFFDIVELVKIVSGDYKKMAEAKKILFNYDIPEEQIIIEADRERINQTLQVLLDNAVKFTKPDGRIRLIISNLYREVEIIITDTGIGIPEKDLPFIFQKFHKVNRQDSDQLSTGIGLVFVKQIVDLHKGLITIQSEPDKGTTVILKLLKNTKERKN
jgi:PAS domain S-box-containing protein